jgi:DNA polymerase I-like protein with 3'-5' exonuclease and polymerase domains
MNMPLNECQSLLEEFDQIVPFIATLAKNVSAAALQRGFIKTLVGHKRHFNLWQPAAIWNDETKRYDQPSKDSPALSLSAAQAKWPGLILQRAYTYKAFNALCQGGAAGQTKTALAQIHQAIGLPQMTVHDEISKSINDEKELKIMEEIMVNCVPLKAPVKAELALANHWS